jgi:imidazolonepropionase-like amidohydrolase
MPTAAGCAAVLALSAAAATAKDLAIHAGRLTGTSKAAQETVTILGHDDRITGVQAGFTAPKGAEVIDLSTSSVLPGLIDDHVHITQGFHKGDPIQTNMTRTDADGRGGTGTDGDGRGRTGTGRSRPLSTHMTP